MHRFDEESVITGFGSYDWQQTHTPATQTAVTISLLLNTGAVSTGKQSMDELGLSCQIFSDFTFTGILRARRDTGIKLILSLIGYVEGEVVSVRSFYVK
jgi:hypothetical protein